MLDRIAASCLALCVVACTSVVRRGYVATTYPEPDPDAQEVTKESGPFTTGLLAGMTFLVQRPYDTYKVRNNIVVVDDESTSPLERLSPALLALPSFSLWGRPGSSLSAIVPLGVVAETGAAGVGLSYGFSVRGNFEVGVALAILFIPGQDLNRVQRESLENQTPLPPGEDKIEHDFKASIGLGIYLAPLQVESK